MPSQGPEGLSQKGSEGTQQGTKKTEQLRKCQGACLAGTSVNRDPGPDTSLQDPTVQGEGGERETSLRHGSPDPRHRTPPPQWATHQTPCSCSTSYFYIKSLLSFRHTCSHRSSWPAPSSWPPKCAPWAECRPYQRLEYGQYVGNLGGKSGKEHLLTWSSCPHRSQACSRRGWGRGEDLPHLWLFFFFFYLWLFKTAPLLAEG